MLTKVLEWHINYGIMKFVFGETDQGREVGVRKEFLREANRGKLAAGYALISVFSVLSAFNLLSTL